ncbi:MAG: FkbM family methyltransferase [Rhodospirillales bacterium]|nr:FkbM family methyltransferase [Rhodospirillales bacterium]
MSSYLKRLILGVRFKLGLVWRREAVWLARRGRHHDAQWRYARATGVVPDSDDSWARLGQYLAEQVGTDLKIEALKAGLGRGAGTRAQSDLILALAGADRLAEALEQASALSDGEACRIVASAMTDRGQHEAAARFARLSTVLEPQSAAGWFQLGSAQAKLEHHQQALDSLAEATALEPGNHAWRATLGQIYADAGRPDDAKQVFRTILQHDPTHALAWSSLALLASKAQNTRHPNEIARKLSEELAGDRANAAAPVSPTQSASRGKPRLRLAQHLLALLPPGDRIVVLDGGARDAHADPRWRDLPPDRLEFHGFEPDPPECERLTATLRELGYAGAYYPIGLGKIDGIQPFHVNKASGGSSFLDQNRAVTDRWRFENPHATSLAREIFLPERTVDMPVATIARWAADSGIREIDFCKLNVQGAELDILAAAGPLLDDTLGVLSEVAFVESYVDRTFFSDIDTFLRNAGFTFFDFLAHHYIGRADSPVVAQHLPGGTGRLGQLVSTWGQLVEAHGFYLRDPIARGAGGNARPMPAARAIKLMVIAEVFGQVEYAFELGRWLAQRPETQDDLAANLRRSLDLAAAEYLGSTVA